MIDDEYENADGSEETPKNGFNNTIRETDGEEENSNDKPNELVLPQDDDHDESSAAHM
jgi:hypothetical protein